MTRYKMTYPPFSFFLKKIEKKNKKIYPYTDGRSATSISWSVFPFVSTTFFFTYITAPKQKVPKIVYRTFAPICSSKGKNNKPTKKLITCKHINVYQCGSLEYRLRSSQKLMNLIKDIGEERGGGEVKTWRQWQNVKPIAHHLFFPIFLGLKLIFY